MRSSVGFSAAVVVPKSTLTRRKQRPVIGLVIGQKRPPGLGRGLASTARLIAAGSPPTSSKRR
jgi:hypothetical protein